MKDEFGDLSRVTLFMFNLVSGSFVCSSWEQGGVCGWGVLEWNVAPCLMLSSLLVDNAYPESNCSKIDYLIINKVISGNFVFPVSIENLAINCQENKITT